MIMFQQFISALVLLTAVVNIYGLGRKFCDCLDGKNGEPGENGFPGEKGDKGSRGERGLPGLHGADGMKGEIGFPGAPGIPGEIGATGVTGAPGYKGLHGLPGLKGEEGEKGVKGSRGEKGNLGFPGPKGPKGDRGNLGKQGYPGPIGIKGEYNRRELERYIRTTQDSLKKFVTKIEILKNSLTKQTNQPKFTPTYQSDKIAQATCAAIFQSHGHVFAVRRACMSQASSCGEICKKIKSPVSKSTPVVHRLSEKSKCFESLHIYGDQHDTRNDSGHRVVRTTYRYGNCAEKSCGPNYCCCKQ